MNERRPTFSAAWRRWRRQVDLDEYEVRWDRLEAEGQDVHGEADFVMAQVPGSTPAPAVLDAGCGMGRVGIELAARGCEVVGVDLDPDLLERAARRAPGLRWIEHDLATLDLGRRFDVVVLAGNVLPFAHREDCPAILAGVARHVADDGVAILGESLTPGWPTVAEIEAWAADAGLEVTERFASWDRLSWPAPTEAAAPDYLVAVLHLRQRTKSRGPQAE